MTKLLVFHHHFIIEARKQLFFHPSPKRTAMLWNQKPKKKTAILPRIRLIRFTIYKDTVFIVSHFILYILGEKSRLWMACFFVSLNIYLFLLRLWKGNNKLSFGTNSFSGGKGRFLELLTLLTRAHNIRIQIFGSAHLAVLRACVYLCQNPYCNC